MDRQMDRQAGVKHNAPNYCHEAIKTYYTCLFLEDGLWQWQVRSEWLTYIQWFLIIINQQPIAILNNTWYNFKEVHL